MKNAKHFQRLVCLTLTCCLAATSTSISYERAVKVTYQSESGQNTCFSLKSVCSNQIMPDSLTFPSTLNLQQSASSRLDYFLTSYRHFISFLFLNLNLTFVLSTFGPPSTISSSRSSSRNCSPLVSADDYLLPHLYHSSTRSKVVNEWFEFDFLRLVQSDP